MITADKMHKARQRYMKLFCLMPDCEAWAVVMMELQEIYLNEKRV